MPRQTNEPPLPLTIEGSNHQRAVEQYRNELHRLIRSLKRGIAEHDRELLKQRRELKRLTETADVVLAMLDRPF